MIQYPYGVLVVLVVVSAAEDMQRRAAGLVGLIDLDALVLDTVQLFY